MLTFMSILDGNWAIGLGYKAVKEVENNVFVNSLIGITIQDGSKRERSMCVTIDMWPSCGYLSK